jgi:hypothetical protein
MRPLIRRLTLVGAVLLLPSCGQEGMSSESTGTALGAAAGGVIAGFLPRNMSRGLRPLVGGLAAGGGALRA